MSKLYLKLFIRYIIFILLILLFIFCQYKSNIIKILKYEHLTDWITAIGTCAIPVVVTIITIIESKKRDKRNKIEKENTDKLLDEEKKKNNELFSIERKAKLYSHVEFNDSLPVTLNVDIIENLYEESVIKRFNLLKVQSDINENTSKILSINIYIKSFTSIFPSGVHLKYLNFEFLSNGISIYTIKTENFCADFKSVPMNDINTYITMNCILTDEQLNFIHSKSYDTLWIETNIEFKNIFKLTTTGTYHLLLKDCKITKSDVEFIRYEYTMNYNIFTIDDIYE